MQGLLKNPLADGSTLGISSGASLGAALAIAFGFQLPRLPFSGPMILAALFSFGSLILILSLSYMLDSSFSTNTIILLGIVYSMFMSSILSLVVTFAQDKLKQITFWTMGSLAGNSYQNALVLFVVLAVCGTILIRMAEELNAFAIGEENAMNVGVDVKRVRLVILITVSLLIGTCVSIGGTIGFVGLVTPHIIRLMTGPNHRRLLPASMFGGATFLTLADLAARTIVPPLELPIGVVTSLVGTNAKMNEFCAAMGICNLRHVDEEILRRKAVAERYRRNFEGIDGLRLNVIQPEVKSNYAYFPVVFEEKRFGSGRDEVFEELARNGIMARKYFYPLTSTFSVFCGKYDACETPVALDISKRILSLPLYADLSLDDVDRICSIVVSCGVKRIRKNIYIR